MCPSFKLATNLCSFIIITKLIQLAYGSGQDHLALDVDNMEHLGNYHTYADSHHSYPDHLGMPFMPTVEHQAPSKEYSNYNQAPQPHSNYEQGNHYSENQNKQPLIMKYENKKKGSIIINANKQNTPPAPIIINRGHFKQLSDIIIHDQKCGSPTRIKETSHGLFGLFLKSHIIIIGKDCKEEPKLIPVFAPKLTTPIYVQQAYNKHAHSHQHAHLHDNNNIGWEAPDEHEESPWSHIDDTVEHSSSKSSAHFKPSVEMPSVSTLSHSHPTTPNSLIPEHFEESEAVQLPSKSSLRNHLWHT